eukprot:CAMPEP_0194151008 /NCGR_PEP_ID=MMETSP0152-20130528/46151_1 /TAXON_ID=1049557 /ORGANISM="Thalassiothrix antarctica, Strain L6-D1" /LENGTH=617 /DNA_ID=CAMNT_0038854427 /DNA_START=173 /DNA_END=2026 /DNA_ORIENTATION=-
MVPKPFLLDEAEAAVATTTTTTIDSSSSSSTVVDVADSEKESIKQTVLGLFGRTSNESSKACMARKKIKDGYFIPYQGLVGHDFWHIYDEDAAEWEMGDRAVLLQSIQNYRKISQNGANFKNLPSNDSEALSDPRFGEQIIVDCGDDNDICLGDVYSCVGGDDTSSSVLKLRVTAPRKSGRELDIKNRTAPGRKGVYHLATSTAMAGWFCQVLSEGSLTEGSELVLVERPHPKWTLQELAKSIYGGEGDATALVRCKPSWGRSEEELKELLAIPYLSECGWKEKLRTIQRHKEERKQPIPYLVSKENNEASSSVVASVLGVYGRADALDEFMARSQVPSGIFAPIQGLKDYAFYHIYDEDFLLKQKLQERNRRAVLMQSIQNYRHIIEEAKTNPHFECFPRTEMDVLLDPCFGEQLILDYPSSDVCLGDLIAATDGSTARFRVTSPRKPCNEIDNRNETVYGPKGLRIYTLSTALAGWFCSVEMEGEVKKGTTFELVERPYPQWPVTEVAKAVYGGEGDPKAAARGAASWGRSTERLQELLTNPYLADYEWKDELRKVLKKEERKEAKRRQHRMLSNWRSTTNYFGNMPGALNNVSAIVVLLAVIASFKMMFWFPDE